MGYGLSAPTHLSLGPAGLLLASVLVVANKKLYVYEDPRIDQVEDLLPKANCGACSTPGCRSFAEKLVDGQITPSQCTLNGHCAHDDYHCIDDTGFFQVMANAKIKAHDSGLPWALLRNSSSECASCNNLCAYGSNKHALVLWLVMRRHQCQPNQGYSRLGL